MKRQRGTASASPHSHKHARVVERDASKGRSDVPASSFAPPRDHHGVRFTQEVRFSARPAEVIVYDDAGGGGSGPAASVTAPHAVAPILATSAPPAPASDADADWGGDVDDTHPTARVAAAATATIAPRAAADEEERAIVAEADELLRHSRLARAHSPKPTHHTDTNAASPSLHAAAASSSASRPRSGSDTSDAAHSVAFSDAFADDEVDVHHPRAHSVARSFFSMAEGGSFARSGSVSSASMSDLSEYARHQVGRRARRHTTTVGEDVTSGLSDGELAVLDVAIAAGEAEASAMRSRPHTHVRPRARVAPVTAVSTAAATPPQPLDAHARAQLQRLAQLRSSAALLRSQAAVADAHAAWIMNARAAVGVDAGAFAAAVLRTQACMTAAHSRLRTPAHQRDGVQDMFQQSRDSGSSQEPLLSRLVRVVERVGIPRMPPALHATAVPLLQDPFLAMPYAQTIAPLPSVEVLRVQEAQRLERDGEGESSSAVPKVLGDSVGSPKD